MSSPRIERLGLGLAALGRPAYITTGRTRDLGADRGVEDLQRRTAEVLDAAYAAGIRYLDCARSYGLSERFLAHWLKNRPDVRDVVVASKWGYRYVGDWRLDADAHEIKDHSLAAFNEQLAATRAELGAVPAVYQVHSVTPDSPLLGDDRLLHRLAELRDGGVRVGISTSGPQQGAVVDEAVGLEVDGAPLFTVVQSTWNLLETSAGPALAAAAAAGVDVVIKEVVANGRLAPGGRDASTAAVTAGRFAASLGVTIDQVAIAAALHQPWAARVLSGAVTPGQLASNLGAVELTIPAGALADLLSAPERPADYWGARSQRSWG